MSAKSTKATKQQSNITTKPSKSFKDRQIKIYSIITLTSRSTTKMRITTRSRSVAALLTIVSSSASFVPPFAVHTRPALAFDQVVGSTPLFAGGSRYGPPQDTPPKGRGSTEESFDASNQEEWEKIDEVRVDKQTKEFNSLIEQVASTSNPEILPGIMTRHMDVLLAMRGYEGTALVENAIEEATKAGGEEQAQEVMATIEFILNFVEEFVDQAKSVDDQNKRLLGKIIRTVSHKTSGSTDLDKELLLDSLLDREKESFTPGFLKHIQGECDRISAAPKITPESSRLLEIMRVIQARVVEEMGKDLGEGALVLGQLLGYDDKNERLAVLEAGLVVRGIGFAKEMMELTEEALEGFTKVPKVDQELIGRVMGIDARIRRYVEKNDTLQ